MADEKNTNELNDEAVDEVTGGTNFTPSSQCNSNYLCAKCKTATPWEYNANGVFACTVCGGTEMGTLRIICPVPTD